MYLYLRQRYSIGLAKKLSRSTRIWMISNRICKTNAVPRSIPKHGGAIAAQSVKWWRNGYLLNQHLMITKDGAWHMRARHASPSLRR